MRQSPVYVAILEWLEEGPPAITRPQIPGVPTAILDDAVAQLRDLGFVEAVFIPAIPGTREQEHWEPLGITEAGHRLLSCWHTVQSIEWRLRVPDPESQATAADRAPRLSKAPVKR